MGNIYGYVRVSTREQHEDRQTIAFEEVHVPAKNIYTDKQSGKDFNRPMYQRLLKKLREDDLLYVKSNHDFYLLPKGKYTKEPREIRIE